MADPLTREQYQAALDAGFSPEQIIENEKRRLGPTNAPAGRKDLVDEMTRRTGQLVGIPYDQPIPSPQEMAAGGEPGLGAAAKTARDVLTIPTHFLNQFGFNYPRSVAANAGYDLPTETDNPVAGAAARTAGFVGGIESPVNKLIAARFFKPGTRLAVKAVGAGLGGFAYAPNEGVGNLGQRTAQAGFAALVPVTVAGLQKTGQFFNGAGRWVARNVGGVSDATVDIIRKLGADRVFDPAKAKADYLGDVVAPKVQERVVQAITSPEGEGEKVLTALGVNQEDVQKLQELAPETRAKLQGFLTQGGKGVGEGIAAVKKAASDQYAAAIPQDASISIRSPLVALRRALIKQGWLNEQGEELAGAGVPNKTKSMLVKILQHYSKPGPNGEVLAGAAARLDGQRYQNLLSELETAVSGNDKFDRLIFAAQDNLRETAAKQIPALGEATKSYADALRLEELQKTFSKLDNVVNFESKLQGLKNVARSQLHKQWQIILGPQTYDDVLAHLANQDFELTSNLPGAGGGIYPSRTGLLRAVIGRGAKSYYQNVAPLREQVGNAASRTLQSMRKAAGY